MRTLVGFRREAERDLLGAAEYQKPIGGDFRMRATVGASGNMTGKDVDTAAVAVTDQSTAKNRQADLARADAKAIAPGLAATVEPITRVIDAAEARGDFERAVVLTAGMDKELGAANAFSPRLQPLKDRAAAAHLDRANQAAALPGARVLNARIAAVYGAQPGVLADLGPLSTGPSWNIVTPGVCGDANGFSTNALVSQLGAAGYAAGSGAAVTLTVTFDDCPLNTTVTEKSEEVVLATESTKEARGGIECTEGETKVDSVSGVYQGNNVTLRRRATCRGDSIEIEAQVVEVRITKSAESRLAANGKIKIELDGVVAEGPFAISATSQAFPFWDESAGRKAQPNSGESIIQVRGRAEAKLVENIHEVTGKVLAAHEAAYAAKIQPVPSLDADHAFFLASQVSATLSAAEVVKYMTSPVLAAALTGQPMLAVDLGAHHRVVLPDVSIAAKYSQEAEVREARGFITVTFTGGYAKATTTGGSGGFKGGGGSLALAIFPSESHYGGGFRMSGAYVDHWLMDIDFFMGLGFHLGWLSISAVSGIGLDFTPGNQEFEAPSPTSFILPVAGYWQYGGRIGYPSAYGTLELMYTKAFRTASALNCEKRGDIRLTSMMLGAPLALTLRYVEYLPDVDGFFTPFSAEGRTAKLLWIFGGVGF